MSAKDADFLEASHCGWTLGPMQRFLTMICYPLMLFALFVCTGSSTFAQQPTNQPKPFAEGVLQVIKPALQARESYSLPMPLPGLNAKEYDPNFLPKQDTLYGQTRDIVFFRDVWNYEFAFLGLRQIEAKGRNIWYMVYRIRNTGATLSYEQVKEDPRFDHMKYDLKRNEKVLDVVDFLPRFSLEGWIGKKGDYDRVVYRDIVDVEMTKIIQNHEDPNRPLLNTYEMAMAKIPLAKSESDPGVWGVAIWEDVDPRIDYVSVYVSGLTNAYQIERSRDGKIGFKYRTLQLNFWRPGDIEEEVKDEVDYGIPLVDDPREQIEICRRYDLPGPVLQAYRVDENANQDVLVFEVDGEVSLKDFKSPLVAELDAGKLPDSVKRTFADTGYPLPNETKVESLVPGVKWRIQDGSGQLFILEMEPQFWEPSFGKTIRFIKSLDHFWIYR